MAAQEAGHTREAIAHFDEALRLAPTLLDVRLLLVFALAADGQDHSARAVLDATPNVAQLPGADLRKLADAATKLGASTTALVAVRTLLAASPNEPELHSTLGALLHRSGALDEAGHVLQRAVLRWPKHVPTLLNCAHWLVAGGAYHEALRDYDRALREMPAHDTARWHRGMLRLMLGDFAGGWDDHEARRALAVHTVKAPHGPAWDGRNAQGRTLLLWGEQGLGDQIQGVRFAQQLADLGATVIVRCARVLVPLFAHVPGVARVVADEDALPAFDAHVPMLSVPYLLRLVDERAFGSAPYLDARAIAATLPSPASSGSATVRARTHNRRARTGVVWAGSPGHVNDARRSLPASLVPDLLRGVATQWVSLQLGERATDLASLDADLRTDIVDAAPLLENFAATASVLATLDRVVTVDTSVAHLAGAMGIPTLLLIPFVPDWRWQLVREDTPLYASVRLLRQPSLGDWRSVVDRAHREMAAGGN